MTITELKASLSLPVIAAPMLLVSGMELVLAACRAGVLGTFPALNARTSEICEEWLIRIGEALARDRDNGLQPAPYAINIIVREGGNSRFEADMTLLEKYRPPVVITSVGNPAKAIPRIHGYGGLVFHDIATVRHAEKAIEAGVDGLILLTAGAGGHTGSASSFAFVRDVRRFWDGAIALAGGISDGYGIRAAEVLGADFAYMGTRFAATQESMAAPRYKKLLVEQGLADILVTDRISGLNATFMRGSICKAGLDPDNLPPVRERHQPDLPEGVKAWRDIWSAGHGVGMIEDIPGTPELVARLATEYREAYR